MDPNSDVAAFILAGGRSTRMGTDKAFVTFEGRTLLARALNVARSITSDVRIVGDPVKFAPFAPVVEDIVPGCGPLAGIHAALRASTAEFNLILAVDMPFVSPALLHFLISRAEGSASTVTLPRSTRGWQPLCAIYRPRFADAAEKALHAGRYKIDALFTPLETQAVEEQDLERAGFSATMFRNLNTPEELAQARE
jgi:molybdopterin-guanine dinucleotide biosynthesis protein A